MQSWLSRILPESWFKVIHEESNEIVATAYYVLYDAIIWLFLSIGFWLWQPYLKLSAASMLIFFFAYQKREEMAYQGVR